MDNKRDWLEREGFNSDGTTFVPVGETYSIKDKLKEAGFKYNMILGWHGPQVALVPCVSIAASDIVTFDSKGHGFYNSDAAALVRRQRRAGLPPSKSEYYGEVGQKFSKVEAIYERSAGFDSRFGYTYVHRFKIGDNLLIWMTAASISLEKNTPIYLSGTIKNHREYEDEKQTQILRCKVKER